MVRDNTQNNTHRAALLKDVRAESTQAFDAVPDIDFRCLFEALLLAVRHHDERHVESVFLFQPWGVGYGMQFASDSHHRKSTDFQVQIRSAMSCGNS